MCLFQFQELLIPCFGDLQVSELVDSPLIFSGDGSAASPALEVVTHSTQQISPLSQHLLCSFFPAKHGQSSEWPRLDPAQSFLHHWRFLENSDNLKDLHNESKKIRLIGGLAKNHVVVNKVNN
jgi:hypothetical protein